MSDTTEDEAVVLGAGQELQDRVHELCGGELIRLEAKHGADAVFVVLSVLTLELVGLAAAAGMSTEALIKCVTKSMREELAKPRRHHASA